MQSALPSARRPSRTRRGFTLVELLVVLVIIGILMAILIPVLGTVIRGAREAEVVAEISNFDKALVEFKNRYGVDVPSFIVLYEDASNWDPANPAVGVPEVSRRASRAFLRQAWPDFDFGYSTGTTDGAPSPGFMDINGNGEGDEVLILNGAECLVFFLGGVCETNVVGSDINSTVNASASAGDAITWWNPLGFSSNPQNPFLRGGNRVGPFYEFDGGENGRLTDFFSVVDEGMPEYLDALAGQQRPYLYLSAYGGAGYRPGGPNGTLGDSDDEIIGIGDIYYSDTALTSPINSQSYQLVSPGGGDFEYGAGGYYDGETVPSSRSNERDNITNFKGGRLN